MSVNVELAYNDLVTNMKAKTWPVDLIVAPVPITKQVWLQNDPIGLRYVLDVNTGLASYEQPNPLPDKDTWMAFMSACAQAYDELTKSRKRFDIQ